MFYKRKREEKYSGLQFPAPKRRRKMDVESMSERQLLKFLLPEDKIDLRVSRNLPVIEILRQCGRRKVEEMRRERREERGILEELASNPLILEVIFSYLPPKDLKTAALVCRTWHYVVEAPRYWTWATASLSKKNFSQRFYSRRFRNVGGVRLEYYEDRMDKKQLRLFLAGVKNLSLTRLDADDNDLSSISAKLLAQVVVGLEEVNLDAVDMYDNYGALELMKTIAKTKNLRLRKLTLGSNLSWVSRKYLTKALLRIEEVELSNMHIRSRHFEDLLLAIRESPEADLRLKRLSLRSSYTLYSSVFDQLDIWDTVNSVRASSWARAVVRLEEVHLPRLSYAHIGEVFQEISYSQDLKLKKLNLDEEVYLTYVPTEVLCSAILRLEEVNLMLTHMTMDQAESLCMKILETEKFNLKSIKINQTHQIHALPHLIIDAVKRRIDLSTFYY